MPGSANRFFCTDLHLAVPNVLLSARIRLASRRPAPAGCFFDSLYFSLQVLVDAFSIPITRKDLDTLRGLNWLNDEIINFYLQVLVLLLALTNSFVI